MPSSERVYFYELEITGFGGDRIRDMKDNFPQNICLSDGAKDCWYARKYYNKSIICAIWDKLRKILWGAKE